MMVSFIAGRDYEVAQTVDEAGYILSHIFTCRVVAAGKFRLVNKFSPRLNFAPYTVNAYTHPIILGLTESTTGVNAITRPARNARRNVE